MTWGNHYYK